MNQTDVSRRPESHPFAEARPSVHFVGTGDAFGSGGKLNTCFYVEAPQETFLVDCGASSLIGLKRLGLDPRSVSTVLITHFHGDHFGGLPFLIRETQIATSRSKALQVLGPAGLEDRLDGAMESFFPGSIRNTDFPLEVLELAPGKRYDVRDLRVLLLPVIHTAGTNPHGIRVEGGDWIIGYSGDTEWTPNLLRLADGADLFISECYKPEPVPNHMDYHTLMNRRDDLACGELVVTHMGPELLTDASALEVRAPGDGTVYTLPAPS